ncbi:MAG: ABC transporter permease [Acidimicrobiales bacterium]
MSDVTFGSVTRSEWIKFRSVRSTVMGVAVFVVLTVGLSVLITSLVHAHWNTMNALDKLTFDPVSTSLAGISLAQFAVGVTGSLFITSEYSSGGIRSTLAAVPVRWRVVGAKLAVLSGVMIVLSEIVCFAAFLIGQAIFTGMIPASSDTLSNGSDLRAVLLGGVYLTLLAALGFGLGLILRQSPATISTFTGLVLIIPIIIFFLPTSLQDTLTKYEPSALGRAMTATTAPDLTFGPGTATAVLALYVAVVLAVGAILFQRRDA